MATDPQESLEQEFEQRIREARGQAPLAKAEQLARLAREVRMKDPQLGVDLSSEVAMAAREAGRPDLEAEAHKTAGICYWSKGDFTKAIEKSIQALEICQRLGDKKGLAPVHNNLGISYYRLNHYDLAIEHLTSCLQLCRELKDDEGEVRALTNLAGVYDDLGEAEVSLNYQLQALEKIDRGDLETEATMTNNIGLSLKAMGDLPRALDFCRRSLESHRRAGNRYQEAISLCNLGNILGELGRWPEARESFREALDLSLEIGDLLSRCLAYNGLGLAAQAEGCEEEAARDFALAMELVGRTGDRNVEHELLINSARSYLKKGNLEEAMALLKRALSLAEESGMKAHLAKTLEINAELYERMGDYNSALKAFRRYHLLDREINSQKAERTRQYLLAKFRLEQTERENILIRQRNEELEAMNRKILAEQEERTKLMQQMERQAREMENMARYDALTGLENRRFLMEALAHEYARARRYQEPLTVAMLDLDHFKQINDRFTHAVGDEVLKVVAGILKNNCRQVDIAGRYGGEEFVIIFPNTASQSAALVCERIRIAVEKHPWWQVAKGLLVTLSGGLEDDILLPGHEKMLSAADIKMYRAKQLGRNRIIFS